jgi:hypothetical protein
VKVVGERGCATEIRNILSSLQKIMSLRRKLGILCAACCNALFAMSSFAQTQTTGCIVGTVRDAQGQVIPQADVLATLASTGAKHKILTNDWGDYALLSLAPGNYEVTISAAALASSISRMLAVSAGETTTLDAILQVAQNSTEIWVTDARPLLRTDNSELGASFDSMSLAALPLSTRNSLQLMALVPGANTALMNNSSLGRNSPQVSVNGARVNQNSYQINGVDANNASMHDFGDVGIPAPESISEMKMQTSMYDASVSGAGGSSVELFTKEGTIRCTAACTITLGTRP